MAYDFKGKVIVVTGAGQGIGYALSKKLYEYGATIYAFSLKFSTDSSNNALKDECPNINTIIVDLTNREQTRLAFKVLEGKAVHGLVNNAGVTVVKPFLELTEKDYDFTFDVNFKALFHVTQLVVPLMVPGSSIVSLSSLASLIGIDGHSVYSATKAAVDSLTKSLALELGEKQIRVNCVNPTAVMTDMGRAVWSDPAKGGPLLARIPLNRFGEIRDVVNPIVFLLSDRSAFINGQSLPIEGGYLAW